jgi:hypothetical protein
VIDPSRTPPAIDTVPIKAYFASISADRRWIAYQALGVTGVYLQPWPALDRRYLVSPDGTEPRWSTENEIFFVGDPLFNDTPGWSHAPAAPPSPEAPPPASPRRQATSRVQA